MSICRNPCDGWRLPEWFGVGEDFQDGFFAGVAFLLVLFLVLLLIKRLVCQNRSASGISIAGGQGDLFISTGAVREFVARVLKDFEGLRLRNLKLRTRGRRVHIILEVGVLADGGLPALRDAVQTRVISEAEERLGLEAPPRVDLRIRSLRLDAAPAKATDDFGIPESEDFLEP
jgi:hypothetical protein